MISCSILATADPALGRVEYYSLSDQTLMEILSEGLLERCKTGIQDSNGLYTDVTDWAWVACSPAARVISIIADRCDLVGSIALDFIPPEVTTFKAHNNALRGTLDSHRFPGKIISFDIGQNKCSGSVDFTGFPASLRYLTLSENDFSGKCDLTGLPPNLESFLVYTNRFSGSANLEELPRSLVECDLSGNEFSGEVCLEKLPSALRTLILNRNGFEGEIRMVNVPENMKQFFAMKNKFSGSVVLGRSMKATVIVAGNDVTSVVDEDGLPHKYDVPIMKGRIYRPTE